MKNVALIIAGGTGSRMGQDIPKQFINVYDKPVIIYTLEKFQNHPLIDEIEVVCLSGWKDVLLAYCKQFNITKLKKIDDNGESGMSSIFNGLKGIASNHEKSEDLNVIIHDGVRPLVDSEIISDLITKCNESPDHCSASVLPINEQIFKKSNEDYSEDFIPRENLVKMVTPQCYNFHLIYELFSNAFADNDVENLGPGTYANTLVVNKGYKIAFAAGSEKNMKLTTKDNLELFKCYLKIEKDSWMK